MRERPSWDEYFMSMAHLASTRSHDAQTQVGCVLVSKKKVVGIGYNGFPGETDDSYLPDTRPLKYPFMVHSEINAISNMIVKPEGKLIAYITGIPCNVCSKMLWQNNVRKFVIDKSKVIAMISPEDEIVLKFLQQNGLELAYLN